MDLGNIWCLLHSWWCQISSMDGAAEYLKKHGKKKKKERLVQKLPVEMEHMGLKCHVEVIGTASGHACAALLVFLDARRYLVGCGEGTQRLCGESRVRMSRVAAVFAPSLGWDSVGGLPGAVLTLAEGGARETRVVGPRGVAQLLANTRAFVNGHAELTFRVTEFCCCSAQRRRQRFEDGVVRVVAVPLSPSSLSSSTVVAAAEKKKRRREDEEEEVEEGEDSTADLTLRFCCSGGRGRVLVSKGSTDVASTPSSPVAAAAAAAVSPTQEEGSGFCKVELPEPSSDMLPGRGEVLCFVMQMPGTPGKFDVVRANALGVPAGPLRARLVRGEAVVTPQGRTVQPSECMGEADPGAVLVYVKCPDESFIPALLAAPAFEPFFVEGESGGAVKLVVHDSPRRVVENPRYAAWAERFAPTALNLLVGEGCCNPGATLEKSLSAQAKMHCIHPAMFPLDTVCAQGSLPLRVGNRPAVAGTKGLRVVLGPAKGVSVDDSAAWRGVDVPRIEAELAANQLLRAQLDALDLQPLFAATDDIRLAATPAGEFRAVFLGTGASLPSRYRNVSGFLLEPGTGIGGRFFLAVDPGESSFWQMSRLYGPDLALQIAERMLTAVFITHIHADHHLGLPKLIELRAAANAQRAARGEAQLPLVVVGPSMLRWWLQGFAAASGRPELVGNNVVFVETKDIAAQPADFAQRHALQAALGNELRLSVAPTRHCPESYGFVVCHKSGWSVVVSGDTRPCDALAEAGQGATLLVHEATFSDELKEEAESKRHSTIGQAVSVGTKMGARFTVLTHFSQRYSKLVPVDPTSALASNVGAAFDLMCISSHRLCELNAILPALSTALADESDAEEES